jgi:hypothetical protein
MGGSHTLALQTGIPRAELALELHSTFVGHSRLRRMRSISRSARAAPTGVITDGRPPAASGVKEWLASSVEAR